MQEALLDMKAVIRLREGLNARDGSIEAILEAYHPSEIAILLGQLNRSEQQEVISYLSPELASETISEMKEEQHPEELLLKMHPDVRKEVVAEFDYDDATDIIAQLDQVSQEEILEGLSPEDASAIRNLLIYSPDSAGGIMNSRFTSISIDLSKKEAIDEIIRQSEASDEFYSIYVVNRQNQLLGIISLKDLLKSRSDVHIADLLQKDYKAVYADTDQEAVAAMIGQYNLSSIPVIDEHRNLLGQITFDDVIDVLQAENTEDILKISGVSEDEELSGSWKMAVRSRLPWLVINLGTAFLAAAVIRYYDQTIAQIAMLAGYMTIIAGMGGNAATQALAVTVRRISLNQLSDRQAWNTIKKEILVGLVNGATNGLIVWAVALIFDGNPMLGLVIFISMAGNLVIAGIAGAGIPLFLKKIGIDPAVASSIIITTFTDIFGFLLPLGLATKMLL